MTANPKSKEFEPQNLGAQFPFARISDPGVYISNWSGHMLRIPEDALKPGRSPVITILGKEQLTVTKLSDDPFLPITRARLIAADLDMIVNF
jgi:hypothetical protein